MNSLWMFQNVYNNYIIYLRGDIAQPREIALKET